MLLPSAALSLHLGTTRSIPAKMLTSTPARLAECRSLDECLLVADGEVEMEMCSERFGAGAEDASCFGAEAAAAINSVPSLTTRPGLTPILQEVEDPGDLLYRAKARLAELKRELAERMKEAGGRQQAGGRLRHAMAKGDIGELEAAIAEAEAAPKMTAAAAARVPYDGAEASVLESCVASADGEVEVEECFVQYG